MVLGIIFSIIVSVFFTLYILPRKFTKQNPIFYMALVGLSFTVVSVIFYFSVNWTSIGFKENLFSPWHLLSALLGILWFFGGLFLNIAIDKVGVSKCNQWKNLQGPIGSILMLIFLSEAYTTNIVYTIFGIVLMFISAMLFTIKKDDETKTELKVGVIFAIAAALMFGLNAFVSKLLTNQGFIYSKNIYFSLFVFLSAFVAYLMKNKKLDKQEIVSKDLKYPLIAGLIYGIAAIFNVLAYNYIAGSVAFSIIQLNAVWTILIGIFIFKEINFKKYWLRISLGMLFAIGSIVLLIFAL